MDYDMLNFIKNFRTIIEKERTAVCKIKEPVIKYRHHFLNNGVILTVCSSLNHETRVVKIGWSSYNPNDVKWVRKIGNKIATDRLKNYPLEFTLSKDEPVICDYISLRALLVILAVSNQRPSENNKAENHPSVLPNSTLKAVQFEVSYLLSLLGQRVGLPPLWSDIL